MTFIWQTHKWRGFDVGRDVMDCMAVIGFVTIFVSRRPLLDRLIQMLEAAKHVRR